MGKSAASAILQEEGVPVIDTDAVAREVVAPGSPGLSAVTEAFGREVCDEQGALRRDRLAELVFSDAEARGRLEGILHPLIRKEWQARVQTWRGNGVEAGVVVIPLLFETGAEKNFESVICIACTPERQSARLRARGWTAKQVAGRLSAQWPIDTKMDRSQFVIWNDAGVEVLREQLRRAPPLKGRPENALPER
jgi:dephospho-CoA kinase